MQRRELNVPLAFSLALTLIAGLQFSVGAPAASSNADPGLTVTLIGDGAEPASTWTDADGTVYLESGKAYRLDIVVENAPEGASVTLDVADDAFLDLSDGTFTVDVPIFTTVSDVQASGVMGDFSVSLEGSDGSSLASVGFDLIIVDVGPVAPFVASGDDLSLQFATFALGEALRLVSTTPGLNPFRVSTAPISRCSTPGQDEPSVSIFEIPDGPSIVSINLAYLSAQDSSATRRVAWREQTFFDQGTEISDYIRDAEVFAMDLTLTPTEDPNAPPGGPPYSEVCGAALNGIDVSLRAGSEPGVVKTDGAQTVTLPGITDIVTELDVNTFGELTAISGLGISFGDSSGAEVAPTLVQIGPIPPNIPFNSQGSGGFDPDKAGSECVGFATWDDCWLSEGAKALGRSVEPGWHVLTAEPDVTANDRDPASGVPSHAFIDGTSVDLTHAPFSFSGGVDAVVLPLKNVGSNIRTKIEGQLAEKFPEGGEPAPFRVESLDETLSLDPPATPGSRPFQLGENAVTEAVASLSAAGVSKSSGSVTVTKVAQTITAVAGPEDPVVGDTFTPVATSDSGLAVDVAVSGAGCSLADGDVTFDAVGSCTITYTQAGDDQYAAADPVVQTFTVVAAVPVPSAATSTITVDEVSIVADGVASSTVTVQLKDAAGNNLTSGGADVTLSTDLGTLSSVTDNGDGTYTATLTATTAGTATITGTVDGAAISASATVTVTALQQTISVTTGLPSEAKVGDTFTPVATSTSGLPVAITVASGSSCSISGGVVTFDAVGSCQLLYDQAGNATFAAAPQVSEAVTVAKQPQSITVTSPLPSDAKVGDTFTPEAESTSDLPVTITVAAGSSSVCSIDGSGEVTFLTEGSCALVYTQVGDATFAAAPEVSEAVTVAAAAAPAPSDQSITVTPLPTDPKVGETFTPEAESTSGLQVTITVASGSSCSIDGSGEVTFDAEGPCELLYDQAGGTEGGTTFTAAPQVSQTVTVEKQPQSITVTPLPTDPKVGDTITPEATSEIEDLEVSVTVAPGSADACSIDDDGEVTFDAEGPCELLYEQTGDGTFAAAPPVSQTVTGEKEPQSITVTAPAPTDPKVGGTFDVEATASSTLGVVVTVAAGSADVCSIDDGEVTFSTEGSCELAYTQLGDGTFAEAPPVSRTVTVARFSQAISIRTTMPAAPKVGDTFTPEATASSGLPVVITVAAGSSDVCAIDEDGVVTFLAIGDCVLLYDQPGDATYAAAPQAVTRSIAPQPEVLAVGEGGAQDGPVPTVVPAGAGPRTGDEPLPYGLLLASLLALTATSWLARRTLVPR